MARATAPILDSAEGAPRVPSRKVRLLRVLRTHRGSAQTAGYKVITHLGNEVCIAAVDMIA
jgi:hypothetical protein